MSRAVNNPLNQYISGNFHQSTFPHLYYMAQRYLAVPASSAAVDCSALEAKYFAQNVADFQTNYLRTVNIFEMQCSSQ